MSSTSAVPALTDWIVSTTTASPLIGARNPDPVTVYDGPIMLEQWPNYCLWVGCDEAFLMPNGPGYALAAESTQEWVGAGNRTRNDHPVIHCVADCWFGDGQIKAVRDGAYGILAAVEEWLRTNVKLIGSGVNGEPDPGVTNEKFYPAWTNKGPRGVLAFDLVFFARIGA